MRQLLLISALLFFFLPKSVFAHPGRTASDGCHYCRTNCDSWGVSWNQRHCHGGYVAPVATSQPILTITPKPTRVPTPAPSPEPSQINIKTEEPEETVLGTETVKPTANPDALTEADNAVAWVMLGAPLALIGWIFYRYRNLIGRKKGGDK
jgi:hypothetical protein